MKKWIIIAAAMIAAGCILFGGAMLMAMGTTGWNGLFTVGYETNRHEIQADFENISIRADAADLVLLPSEDESCTVVCHEQEKIRHTVEVKDGTLSIEVHDTRKWYEHIEISFDSPKVTVYLPKGAYGTLSIRTDTSDTEISADFQFTGMDIEQSTGHVTNRASVTEFIKIKTSTGGIRLADLTAGTLDLSVSTGTVTVSDVACAGSATVRVSTGDARLTNVTCQSLTSTGNTGDLTLTNVLATEAFSLERSTGDVKFEACDAAEISVKTDTGRVSGTLLSDKVFITKTSTGTISVPESLSGGRCAITTSTGDIRIQIVKTE